MGKYATLRVHHKKSHVKDVERGEVAKRSSKGERELFQAEKSWLQVKIQLEVKKNVYVSDPLGTPLESP